MRNVILGICSMVLCGNSALLAEQRLPPVAVLVELFTSEGCSTCPAADAVLEELARQPVEGAVVIPLAHQVDYWDDLGWKDPFASKQSTQRQYEYANAFGGAQVYTPQMIVDGATEFSGTKAATARAAIGKAAQISKAKVELKVEPGANAHERTLTAVISDLPKLSVGNTAHIMLAITEDNLQSDVSRGENAGRKLSHVAVVRRIAGAAIIDPRGKQGDTTGEGPVTYKTAVPLDQNWKEKDLHAVVFVQEHKTRKIIAAATISLAPVP
jgi:hypothetical protein